MKASLKRKKKKTRTKEQVEEEVSKQIEEVQKSGTETKDVLEQIEACNINNVIHAAKTQCMERHRSDWPKAT